jgi:hypothetical protein
LKIGQSAPREDHAISRSDRKPLRWPARHPARHKAWLQKSTEKGGPIDRPNSCPHWGLGEADSTGRYPAAIMQPDRYLGDECRNGDTDVKPNCDANRLAHVLDARTLPCKRIMASVSAVLSQGGRSKGTNGPTSVASLVIAPIARSRTYLITNLAKFPSRNLSSKIELGTPAPANWTEGVDLGQYPRRPRRGLFAGGIRL